MHLSSFKGCVQDSTAISHLDWKGRELGKDFLEKGDQHWLLLWRRQIGGLLGWEGWQVAVVEVNHRLALEVGAEYPCQIPKDKGRGLKKR